MRANPSLASSSFTVYDLNGVSQTGFTYAVQAIGPFIRIQANKAGHGLTDGWVVFNNLLFDANL